MPTFNITIEHTNQTPQPLSPIDVEDCIANINVKAHSEGLTTQMPRSWRTSAAGVSLDIYTYDPQFTWEMLLSSVLQAENTMKSKGMRECMWRATTDTGQGRREWANGYFRSISHLPQVEK